MVWKSKKKGLPPGGAHYVAVKISCLSFNRKEMVLVKLVIKEKCVLQSMLCRAVGRGAVLLGAPTVGNHTPTSVAYRGLRPLRLPPSREATYVGAHLSL